MAVIALLSGVIAVSGRVGNQLTLAPNAPASDPAVSAGCLDAKGNTKCKKTAACSEAGHKINSSCSRNSYGFTNGWWVYRNGASVCN